MTLLEYFENKANRQAYFWEKEILQQVQNKYKLLSYVWKKIIRIGDVKARL